MSTNILVPELGDSVLEATIIRWLKKEGDRVSIGETIVELETEKANFEVAADLNGILSKIERNAAEDVEVGDVLGTIDEKGIAKDGPVSEKPEENLKKDIETKVKPVHEIKPVDEKPDKQATPVARKIAEQNKIDLSLIEPSGPTNKITKEDVEKYLDSISKVEDLPSIPSESKQPPSDLFPSLSEIYSNRENIVKMSRRRRTIARRLKEAQETAAILTTFNEFNMHSVMELRKRKNEEFKIKHGVKIGFSSFFVKASIGALKAFPVLNAEIQDEEIIYKNYYDIGFAIGSEEGLVVPVIREADRKTFAEIELIVKEFSVKASEGNLSLDELMGGTFTITNGGVFGSLMSTPILNPPQVGILGLHKIENRPVVEDEDIVIRPMMYAALSYDHRIVDGREAVQFLVKLKELIEDPESLLIEG